MLLVKFQLLFSVERARQELQLLYGGDEAGHQMLLTVISTELEMKIKTKKYWRSDIHLASVTVHHGPDMDLSLVDVLHHPDCPDDGPVLVVVPLTLHAEHGAPLVLLIPLLRCERKIFNIQTGEERLTFSTVARTFQTEYL